jgi:hypothetical protein
MSRTYSPRLLGMTPVSMEPGDAPLKVLTKSGSGAGTVGVFSNDQGRLTCENRKVDRFHRLCVHRRPLDETQ